MTVHVNWREDAACRDADPELFFPVGTAGPALRQVDRAKRICGACPVRTPCLAWALDQGILSGVWGGTTEVERRAIRRASCGDAATGARVGQVAGHRRTYDAGPERASVRAPDLVLDERAERP